MRSTSPPANPPEPERSEGEHANLTAALAAVQARLPTIGKSKSATVPTKSGGSYTYRYADLAEVQAAVLPLLSAEGLAWTCLPQYEDGRLLLRGQLRHVGGETLEAAWPLPADGSPEPYLVPLSGRSCSRMNPDKWIVLAQNRVDDGGWCGRCCEQVFA